jgi:hypothetical protein
MAKQTAALIGTTKRRKRRTATKKVAKRRRTTTHNKMVAPRRRRKVSGMGEELTKSGQIVIAAVVGGVVGRMVQKIGALAPKDSKASDYRPYIGIAVGLGAMTFGKNAMLKSAGVGCASVSAMGLIPEKDIPTIGAVRMIGANKPHVITLSNKKKSINRPRMIAGNAHSVNPLIGRTTNYSGGIGY